MMRAVYVTADGVPEDILHTMQSDDIRWSLCGRWVGDGTWRSSDPEPDLPSCSDCDRVLDRRERRRR